MPPKAIFSWSSGKDSAFALHKAREAGELHIGALFSTYNESYDRIAIHGTRRAIAQAQARALGLPLIELALPDPCSNEDYQRLMAGAITSLKDQGYHDWVFGDLFLEDIRAYREEKLTPLGLRCHFPLWQADTKALAQDMIASGLIANIVTLDPSKLPAALCGARYDAAFLAELPETVDPCGENGEFHTVVSYAPGFSAPLDLTIGETVERAGFVYTDFILNDSAAPSA